MKFSEKLQTLRKNNKLSQEQLADMLDVSRQAVSKWEGGQTYPEMDKLLSMCKIFGCTLDDLTNDEIKEISNNYRNKNITSNLVDELLDIINRTCKIFRNLKLKNILKIIFEMIIVVIILLLFNIPVQYIYSLGVDIFMNFGLKIGNILSSIFNFVLSVIYIILSIIIFIYVYKIRVLDHYEKLNLNENTLVKKDKVVDLKEKDNILENNQPIRKEVIIKKERNYVIFKVLGSIVMWCIKIFIIFLSLPFIFSLLMLFASLIIDIIIIFKGVFYFGIFLGILSCITLNIGILTIIFNFIFNRSNDVKKLFIMFLVSLSTLGIAIGITTWDITNINFIEGVPNSFKLEKYETNYEMNNELVIIDYYHNINFKVDEHLGNNLKIEINYYSDYENYYTSCEDNHYIFIHQKETMTSLNKLVNSLLDDLANKRIHFYEGLSNNEITVSATSKNIDILKNNIDNYNRELEERYENSTIEYYRNMINDYEEKINSLHIEYDEKIDVMENEKRDLEEEINNLKEQITEYKNTIKDYKDTISSILNN